MSMVQLSGASGQSAWTTAMGRGGRTDRALREKAVEALLLERLDPVDAEFLGRCRERLLVASLCDSNAHSRTHSLALRSCVHAQAHSVTARNDARSGRLLSIYHGKLVLVLVRSGPLVARSPPANSGLNSG